MGIWGRNDDIALLRKDTDQNKSDIISLGEDFSDYKNATNERVKEILDYMKVINTDLVSFKKNYAEFKEWLAATKQEEASTEKAKEEFPDKLTCKEIAHSLKGFLYLTETTFRYYLYENGILDMVIKRCKAMYKISDDFSQSKSGIKKYAHLLGSAVVFDKEVVDYLIDENAQELQDSILRYRRKMKQFKDSKQHLSEKEVKNLKAEIGIICGTNSTGGYNKDRWASIYQMYGKSHPNYWDNYNTYVDSCLKEYPNMRKPSMITYLVQEAGDGDILLKIACELYVK